MSDPREFHEAVCWLCKQPAAWLVYERSTDDESDWLLTCEKHKTAAFS